MVKLTKTFLLRQEKAQMLLKKYKNESDKEYLLRLTHLKLQNRFIDKIEKCEGCRNVTAVYLHNNLLTCIENLQYFPNITFLYLQRNKINKIENLSELLHLKKLYLGYNEIAIIENLERLCLKELHVEHQNLPLGDVVHFDPRSIKSLSVYLEVLNVSGNNLRSLSGLSNLSNLRELISHGNKLDDLNDLKEVLPTMPNLTNLDLLENPVVSRRAFLENVVLVAKSLATVNGKDIPSNMREFVEGRERALQARRTASNSSGGGDISRSRSAMIPSRAVKFAEMFCIPVEFLPKGYHLEDPLPTPFMFPAWKLRHNVNIPSLKQFPRKLTPTNDLNPEPM